MNLGRSLVCFAFFLFSLGLNAEVIHFPQGCPTGILEVKNLKKIDSRIWLQKFKATLVSEEEIILKASSTLKYSLKTTGPDERFSILNMDTPSTFKTQLICNQNFFTGHAFEGGQMTFRKSDLVQNKIWLQNLFPGNNSFNVELLNSTLKMQRQFHLQLPSYKESVFSIPTLGDDWDYIRVSAVERFTAFNLTQTGSVAPVIVTPQASKLDPQAAYFLVEHRSGDADSYVIKILDPVMLARARMQVADPHLEKIIFAKIEKGSNGFNRNWSKPEKSFWSWSVSEVTGFADIGSTACNGYPQGLEDRLEAWLEQPGQTCFWSYRVKKELTLSEVQDGLE